MAAPNTEIIYDGSVDFSGGIDSLKVPTIQSQLNPNGLGRNQLAWASNCIFRDGAIGQRGGWQMIGNVVNATTDGPGSGPSLYQGGFMYQPDVGDAYIVCSIAGTIWKVTCDGNPPVNLSTTASIQTPGSGIPLNTWNVTLQRLTFQSPQPPPAQPFEDFIAPHTITCPPNYSGPLGNGPNAFQSFVMTAVGTNSVVTLASHYGGNVGDTVFLSAFVNGLFHGINFYGTYTFKFQVVAFTPLPAGAGGTQVVLTNPPTQPQAYFCQAENFLVIQAGDGVTLPLFWDGATLRRSRGITNTAVAASTPNVNEIPAATCMDYYMGRLWYAQNRSYSAGDIVSGASGTQRYNFRDAVLNVTESPLVLGSAGAGDGFAVPTSDGPVTAIFHNGQIDASLGQGRLFIGTVKAVYAQTVPITRQNWIATDNTNQPLQTVVLLTDGPCNDRSVAVVNGDAFYQSVDGTIRSLKAATRFFAEWGNVPISDNVDRVFSFVNTSLLSFVSGTVFQNRLWETSLPSQTPQGVVHPVIVPIDFTPISTFEEQLAPIFEGIYEGLNHLQLFNGLFSGTTQRAFSLVVSSKDNSIDLYEITGNQRFDNPILGTVPDLVAPGVDNSVRVKRVAELPAYTWGKEFTLKELLGVEMWIDRVYGDVHFQLDYRPDGDTCWHLWHQWDICSARNSCEDLVNPICYPLTPYKEGYKQTFNLPKPKELCASQSGRPLTMGFQFQPRLTITGWCRVRGFMFKGAIRERGMYENMVC